ncbi:uncharacterized protein FOMMEDRAFT_18899 [Fomitiporia mediterranea MF3/22]|uniref:uncharacterized protein n=1 Tax=Fomitiporia mediterranea (strain MF3/22) TaxID=694068 RepID=UPI0004408414|nr:uncharacterized protein FOMMEDRAFT_18899 [Fomitiporia mediterranea MF3/22]EJD03493.1 hypothetical protein FOMMEDRAFT_18899 [Fomitiporia mediterranea MF3/22]
MPSPSPPLSHHPSHLHRRLLPKARPAMRFLLSKVQSIAFKLHRFQGARLTAVLRFMFWNIICGQYRDASAPSYLRLQYNFRIYATGSRTSQFHHIFRRSTNQRPTASPFSWVPRSPPTAPASSKPKL